MSKRYSLYLALAIIGTWFSHGIGAIAAGDTPAQRKAIAAKHNDYVVACTEQAAKRYSVCLSGDQNLLPDWAKEPRIPMYDLDEYYRDPAIGWPSDHESSIPYMHFYK